MSPEPSRIVLGVEDIDRKYEVIEKLAEGGMGAVYRARHLLLDEVRVIKTVRPQYRDDPELRERFMREARVATHLHHPNIARIHDLSVGEDGTACIVMEFVQGVNLADRLQRQPPLAQHDILEITRQTLDALGYLHQRKIVHRDISPDNIMLARDSERKTQVKLIDLGIAKPLEGAGFQTKTAMFIGKIRYASPEQLGGGGGDAPGATAAPIDGRSDLYSLGVVLYELLTGEFPIRGTDEASVIAGHLFHPPREFSETDPQGAIPEPLRRVLMHALQKRPETRFQSAAEFSRALQEAAGGTVAGAAIPGLRTAQTLIQTPTPSLAHPTAAGDATVLAPGTPVPAGLPGTRTAPSQTLPAEGPATDQGRRGIRPYALSLAALVAVLLVVGAVYLVRALAAGDRSTGSDPSENPFAEIDFGNYQALVIGNSQYRYQPALETAARDAREIAHVLENRYGFTVTLLQDADRRTIVTALDQLAKSATEEDNLLVYFAGHGEIVGANRAGNWFGVDSRPDDMTDWINNRYDVAELLNPSLARHVLVIADSCFSGSLARTSISQPPSEAGGGATLSREQVLAELQRPSRLVLASGGLSPVVDSGGDGHSIFSGALLEALRANQGLLSIQEIYQQVTPAVLEKSTRLNVPQRPQFGVMDGAPTPEGEFFFLPEIAAPASSAG